QRVTVATIAGNKKVEQTVAFDERNHRFESASRVSVPGIVNFSGRYLVDGEMVFTVADQRMISDVEFEVGGGVLIKGSGGRGGGLLKPRKALSELLPDLRFAKI